MAVPARVSPGNLGLQAVAGAGQNGQKQPKMAKNGQKRANAGRNDSVLGSAVLTKAGGLA